MWEWHALGHIAVRESNSPPSSSSYPWDYAHVNSIDPGPAGDVLLSARNTWTLYDVDIHSGAVRWRLGGKRSSFRLGRGVPFYWQHDARFQPGGLISLFDNGSDPPKEKQSRGLLLAPDLATHAVTLRRQLVNPTRTLLAESQGTRKACPAAAGCSATAGCRTSPSSTHPARSCSTDRSVAKSRTSRPGSRPGAVSPPPRLRWPRAPPARATSRSR